MNIEYNTEMNATITSYYRKKEENKEKKSHTVYRLNRSRSFRAELHSNRDDKTVDGESLPQEKEAELKNRVEKTI